MGAVGAHAVARQEGAGQDQVPAAGRERAVGVVVLQDGLDRVLQVAVAGDEVGQGGVAVAVLGLGGGDHRVGVEAGVAGLAAQELPYRAGGVAGQALQPVGDHEGARVDERVARDAVLGLQLHEGVERVAGRLAADAPPERVAAVGDRERQREQLGHALDGERLLPVSDAVQLPFDGGDGHAEGLRVGGGEGRDVVGDLAPAPRRPGGRLGGLQQHRPVQVLPAGHTVQRTSSTGTA